MINAPVSAAQPVGLTCTISDTQQNRLTYGFGNAIGGVIRQTVLTKNGTILQPAGGPQPIWSYVTNSTNDVVLRSTRDIGWMIVIDQNDGADLVHNSNIVGHGLCQRAG